MKVSYDKLWKLLIDNKMKKSDLAKAAQISQYTMTNLLQDFLARHAISQEQFDKSFGDMMSKMGFDTDGNSTK